MEQKAVVVDHRQWFRWITTRYESRCNLCGSPIKQREHAYHNQHQRLLYCSECVKSSKFKEIYGGV